MSGCLGGVRVRFLAAAMTLMAATGCGQVTFYGPTNGDDSSYGDHKDKERRGKDSKGDDDKKKDDDKKDDDKKGDDQECSDRSCPGEHADHSHVGDKCCKSECDVDDDNVPDDCDNCKLVKNESQKDSDNDGVGDACDNCPNYPNPDQFDDDYDGIGNACDNCPDAWNKDQKDSDKDGVGDVCDNCPDQQNPQQTDFDQDGKGDVCDDECDGVSGVLYLYKDVVKEKYDVVDNHKFEVEITSTGSTAAYDQTFKISEDSPLVIRLRAGTYHVTEKDVPPGYHLKQELDVSIPVCGIANGTLIDVKTTAKLKIKKDVRNCLDMGASFAQCDCEDDTEFKVLVKSLDGNDVETVVTISEKDPAKLVLPIGKYLIKEIDVPEGYDAPREIKIELKADRDEDWSKDDSCGYDKHDGSGDMLADGMVWSDCDHRHDKDEDTIVIINKKDLIRNQ